MKTDGGVSAMVKLRKRIHCNVCGQSFWFECDWYSEWPKKCECCGADYVALGQKRREEKALQKEMFGI